MLDTLKERIKNLEQQIEQSILNHNVLLGARQEVLNLVKTMEAVAPVVEVIDPALKPTIDTIEAVAQAIE